MVTGVDQGSGCDSRRLLVHISADQGVWPGSLHQDLPFTTSFPPDRPRLLNVLLSPQIVPISWGPNGQTYYPVGDFYTQTLPVMFFSPTSTPLLF